ncbi:tetratricopeptide repeat protein [Aliihoeflea aestuarii]|uniref:tetratricopeptide repeat protein n=1 Tax=Aliihoeflea aestuarii TaxID=453840 RepID=UPI002091E6D8|nr:tetratricopeptide repeat protein [Aliihoeflea aestuarii]MCO6390219.1 tetratricopeptide repeat protein [Aliihoeflea aestuarii]
MSINREIASGRKRASLLVALAATLALGGCANVRQMTTGSVDRTVTGSVTQMTAPELRATANQLGNAYKRNPGDMNVAMQYAEVLQMDGRADQSLAVMRKAAIDHPEERRVLAAYGKALAAAGDLQPALDAVRRAQTPEYPDWKLMSAEGAILDQLGQPADARRLYTRALDLAPNDPSVLSNLGMSHLLEGDLKGAETHLQNAVAQPGADSRVRQNLALVVGLQGRFADAEAIATRELSPEQAQANVAYLRSMLVQQNAWNDLAREEG